MQELERKLGHTFKDKKLLTRALSHSSYANESKQSEGSNERLEFLGDSVLSLIVAEYIFTTYKDLPEGNLTRMRAAVVCEDALCEFAKKFDLGSHLLLGKGELRAGGNTRPSILADAFEAVLAALYLDGGFEVAKAHVLKYVVPMLKTLEPTDNTFRDYKTLLQEIIQKNPEEIITYVVTGESGPDHDKSFEVEVRLNSNVIGKGEGHSKKAAEQAAAKVALKLMGEEV